MTLNEVQPGMRVAYVPKHAEVDRDAIEFGTVSSKNAKYVFVKFDEQVNRFGLDGTTAKACNPKDLVMAI